MRVKNNAVKLDPALSHDRLGSTTDQRRRPNRSGNAIIFSIIVLISVALMLFQAHILNLDELTEAVSVWTSKTNAHSSKSGFGTKLHRSSKFKFPARKPRHGGRLRVAFAITMTKDGNFLDGAAILAYSIAEAARGKEYDWSLVAFVHPNVTTSRPGLTKLGFHVIEAPIPIK